MVLFLQRACVETLQTCSGTGECSYQVLLFGNLLLFILETDFVVNKKRYQIVRLFF